MSLPGPVLCICGPTASGKSELSERIAELLHTDIISVDSMQIYRGMDIGTAKIPCHKRKVPLQMVDVASIDENYSVATYQKHARAIVDERLKLNRIPILCGGTGLYMDAVIDEMHFPKGEIGAANRKQYEEFLATEGSYALWKSLDDRDPESAKAIHPHNTRRIIRALEMLDGGTSYAAHLQGLKQRPQHYQARLWALDINRDTLYERIDKRVDLMIDLGLVDEVKTLNSQGLQFNATARQAIGYKEILNYLDGQTTFDKAIAEIKQRSRRYAKRQVSWLRRDGRMTWIDIEHMGMEYAANHIAKELTS